MSVELVEGDMFESGAEALVNTVNCVGVMGKGLALEFKRRFPNMFRTYALACKCGEVRVGRMCVVDVHGESADRPHSPGLQDDWTPLFTNRVVNFPTKENWRNPSKLEYIESGLDDLRRCIVNMKFKSIAVPALGCQNGGLDWDVVRPLIEKKLDGLDCRILLYGPRL